MKGSARLGHRLVAELYLPNPDNLPIVDHINRVRDDNRLENLRLGFYSKRTIKTVSSVAHFNKLLNMFKLTG